MFASREEGGKIFPFIYPLWIFSLGAVVGLSLLPDAETPIDCRNADKIGHLFAYLWLALLPALVMKRPKWRVLLFAGLVSLGAVLEVGQMCIPGRMFSFADMGANAAGVFLGIFVGKRYRTRLWRRFSEKMRPDQKRMGIWR